MVFMELQEEFDRYFTDVFVFESTASDIENALSVLSDGYEEGRFGYCELDDEDALRHRILAVSGASTQGVHLIESEEDLVRVCVPLMASETDVNLAFSLLRQLRADDPGMIVMGASGAIVDIDSKAEEEAVRQRFDRLCSFIEGGPTVAFGGIKRSFYLSPGKLNQAMPGATVHEKAELCMMDFADLQWNYDDIPEADYVIEHGSAGDIRVNVVDAPNRIVPYAPEIKVFGDHCYKVFDTEEFVELVAANPCFHMLDSFQFVIEEMPKDAWTGFFESLPGKVTDRHRVFLLRWNPSFSSFTEEDFEQLRRKDPSGFIYNWSIYEWQEARDGDIVFMLRESDEDAGIVWAGVMLSDPYEGEDWAGTDRRRYYCDMLAQDFDPDGHALLSVEALEQEIPEIDWHCGHAGQLLPFNVEQRLVELWTARVNKGGKASEEIKVAVNTAMLSVFLSKDEMGKVLQRILQMCRPADVCKDVTLLDDDGRNHCVDVMVFAAGSRDLTAISYGMALTSGNLQLLSFALKVKPVSFLASCEVLAIEISESGLAAYVTVDYQGSMLTFYDSRYLYDKKKLHPGDKVEVAISAIISEIEPCEAACSPMLGPSEKNRYDFTAVVDSRTRKADQLGLPAYRTELLTALPDSAGDVVIAALYPMRAMEVKPRKGDLVKGVLYLQGYFVEKAGSEEC